MNSHRKRADVTTSVPPRLRKHYDDRRTDDRSETGGGCCGDDEKRFFLSRCTTAVNRCMCVCVCARSRTRVSGALVAGASRFVVLIIDRRRGLTDGTGILAVEMKTFTVTAVALNAVSIYYVHDTYNFCSNTTTHFRPVSFSFFLLFL